MKLVSACLLGINCKWNGKSKPNKKIIALSKKEVLVPICPEQLGGLSTPRKPAGIYGGLGEDVLDGCASVKAARDGEDLTEHFVKGAEETLRIAKLLGVKEVILKQGSPSCGYRRTFQLDEKLRNRQVEGNGVTAALLKRHGIYVKTQEDL